MTHAGHDACTRRNAALQDDLNALYAQFKALAQLMDEEVDDPNLSQQPGDRIRQVLDGTWTP